MWESVFRVPAQVILNTGCTIPAIRGIIKHDNHGLVLTCWPVTLSI